MKFTIRIQTIVGLTVLTLFSESLSAQTKQNMIWGITGHPLSQESYLYQQPHFKNDISHQLNVLTDCGLTWYRTDVITSNKGEVLAAERFELLKRVAREKGIKILPIIFLSGLDFNASEADMYALGYSCMYNFMIKHGKNFDVYELGNEEEGKLFLQNTGQLAGIDVRDYDQKKAKITASYFKGMIAAMKSVKPTAKSIINVSWVHFGYLDLLINEGVKFDIVGYHWYSDMGELDNVRTYNYNILNIAYSKFKKPIWITEINKRDGDAQNTSAEQARQVKSYMKQARANKHVQAFFIYELYDEPVFAPSSEANYGIVSWEQKYTKPVYKPVAYAIRSLIKGK